MRILRDCLGATAIEYGLIAALIVLGCMAGLLQLGNSSTGVIGFVDSKVSPVLGQ
jgi:pilus assembly protein Flp/PilA